MATKIDKKIVSYSLVDTTEVKAKEEAAPAPAPQVMNEDLERPEVLRGTTYKIKPPVLENALYITINDVVMNEGTPNEKCHPFEIFVNSKNMDHFQWIVGLTRVMSAVFRKGGDVSFLVEELNSVFDPSGGYFKKGGKYMPSLVAEIGEVLKSHLEKNGIMKSAGLDEHQQELVNKKIEEVKASGAKMNEDGYPDDAHLCTKCNTKAMVLMDGCRTCLSCGESKCQ